MDHIFFVCSSVEHLGCFHFLTIVNIGATDICVQVSVWTYV